MRHALFRSDNGEKMKRMRKDPGFRNDELKVFLCFSSLSPLLTYILILLRYRKSNSRIEELYFRKIWIPVKFSSKASGGTYIPPEAPH